MWVFLYPASQILTNDEKDLIGVRILQRLMEFGIVDQHQYHFYEDFEKLKTHGKLLDMINNDWMNFFITAILFLKSFRFA